MWTDGYEDHDPEGPSQADLDRFGDETIACPNCRTDVYDALDTCPVCNANLHPRTTKPPRITALIAVVIVFAILAAVAYHAIF